MYLRFLPFAALIPSSFILQLIKIRLSYFALDNNDRGTRKRIETELTEFFYNLGIFRFKTECNGNYNSSEVIDQKKLIVNVSFQTTIFHKLEKYMIIMGPKKWDWDSGLNFSEDQLINVFTNQEFAVIKLRD